MNSRAIHYFVFLLNPFLGLISVLKDFRSKNIAFFFPIFLAFIGASFYPYGDIQRYRDRFYEMHDKTVSWDNFKSSLLDGVTSFDVAVPTISYFIASFTRNEKILYAVFGLILGFFYGRNIQFLLDKFDKKNADRFVLLLIFTFSMFVTFWEGINGVRMWTAAHIYFYGVSRILVNKELKFWPFLVLACAYHFSFLLPTIIFLGYFFLPKRNLLFPAFIFFIVSMFVAQANFDFIKEVLTTYSPVLFENKVKDYTGEEYVDLIANQSINYSLHFKYSASVINFTIASLLVFAYYRTRKVLKFEHPYYRCFLFVFIFFGFANFFSVLPSGSRFIKVALMFSILPIYFGYKSAKKKHIYYASILPLLFWLIVTLRTSFYTLTIGSIIGNPLVIFFDFATEQNLDSLIK